MKQFNFLYGLYLSRLILSQVDNLATCLQKKDLSASEGKKLYEITVGTLKKSNLMVLKSYGKRHWKNLKNLKLINQNWQGKGKDQPDSLTVMMKVSLFLIQLSNIINKYFPNLVK